MAVQQHRGQHIIESHMGLIDCSREDGRTIFRIRLPLPEPGDEETKSP